MAAEIGVVYVPVVPSGKGFGKAVEGQITTAADSGSKKGSASILSKIGGAFGKVGKIGVGAIGTIGAGIVGLAAKGGFERALNIENAQAKLKGLGHDSSSVTEIMNDALASVKGTAFGLGDAATVAASLSAAGVQQGGELTNVLKTVADTAQISGRSLTDIGTIFGSVAARGKLQGDDMLQLMSSGVPVLQLLAKHLHTTSANVSDMVSQGKIDFKTFAAAMQEGMGGAALSAGNTFTGALANVKAALGRLGEQAATPLLGGLRVMFNQAIPLIDGFTAQMTPVMANVGAAMQSGLEQAIPTITAFFSALSQSSVVQSLGKFLDSLRDSVVDVAGQLQYFFDEISGNGQVLNAFSGVASALSSVLSGMAGVWESATTAVTNFILGVSDARGVQNLVAAIGDLAKNALNMVGSITNAAKGIYDFANQSGLAYDMGQTLSGILNILANAMRFVGDNLNWLAPLATGIGGVVLASKGLGAVSTGLAGIAKGAAGIEKGAGTVFDFFAGISDAAGMVSTLKKWATGLDVVKNAQLAWTAVTKAATAVQLAFEAVMATSIGPIALIVAAVAAVVGALALFFTQTDTGRKAWASFAGWLSATWQSLKNTASSVFGALGSFFSGLWSSITSTASNMRNGFKSTVTGIWGATVSAASGLWSGISKGVSTAWDVVVSVFKSAASAVGNVMANIVTVIGAVPVWIGTQLLNGINGLFSKIMGLLTGWASNSTGIVHTLLEGVIGYVTYVWDVLSGVVSTGVNLIRTIVVAFTQLLQGDWQGAWTTISGFFTTTWNNMVAFFTPILTTIWTTMQTVLLTIQTTWTTMWQAVGDFFTGIWNGMVAFVSPIIAAIGAVISAGLAAVQGAWNAVWSAVSGFFVGVWNGIVAFAAPILATLGGIINGAVNAIHGAWNAAWSAISGFFSGVWNGMVGAASRAVGAIRGVVSGIYGVVRGALSGAATWLVDVGSNIVKGLINGIKDAFGWLKSTITDMGSNVLDWAKSVLHIHSPSQLFRDEVGVMIGRGMALGIDDSMKTVRKSVSQMGSLTDGLGFNGSTSYAVDSTAIQGGGGLTGPSRAVTYSPHYDITQQDPSLVMAAIDARDKKNLAGLGGDL